MEVTCDNDSNNDDEGPGGCATGQLISEWLFDVLKFPKKQWKFWQISALESRKWSNHKIKAYYYNDWNMCKLY